MIALIAWYASRLVPGIEKNLLRGVISASESESGSKAKQVRMKYMNISHSWLDSAKLINYIARSPEITGSNIFAILVENQT